MSYKILWILKLLLCLKIDKTLKKNCKNALLLRFFYAYYKCKEQEIISPHPYLGSAQDASEACRDGGVLDSAHPAGLINNRSDICRVCDSYGLQQQKSMPYHSKRG